MHDSCSHACMKTITLTDEAYERLLSWKGASQESFSKVVLSVVPKKGTLGQMLEDVKSLPALSSRQVRVMEEAATWGRKPETLKDKWTS